MSDTNVGSDFTCPVGGDWYACGNSTHFVGCCDGYACGENGCSDGNLKRASFAPSAYGKYSDQSCKAGKWYTCADTDPPFVGCCTVNACQALDSNGKASGCPDENLFQGYLSSNPAEAQKYMPVPPLDGTFDGTSDDPSATATTDASECTDDPCDATDAASSDVGPASSPKSKAGAIAGGVLGGVFGFLFLTLLLLCCLRRRRRKQQREAEKRKASSGDTTTAYTTTSKEMEEARKQGGGAHASGGTGAAGGAGGRGGAQEIGSSEVYEDHTPRHTMETSPQAPSYYTTTTTSESAKPSPINMSRHSSQVLPAQSTSNNQRVVSELPANNGLGIRHEAHEMA